MKNTSEESLRTSKSVNRQQKTTPARKRGKKQEKKKHCFPAKKKLLIYEKERDMCLDLICLDRREDKGNLLSCPLYIYESS